MNFATLKSLVKRNLGNRTDIDSLISQWVNGSYLDLVTAAKLPELGRFEPIPCPALDTSITFETVEGTASYRVLSNTLFVISARCETIPRPLFRKTIRWYDRYTPTTPGSPRYYIIYGGVLYLSPTPDDTYEILLRVRTKIDVPALQTDSDVPVIDPIWHEAIVLGASHRGALSLEYPDAQKWLQQLKTFVMSHSEQYTEEEVNASESLKVIL